MKVSKHGNPAIMYSYPPDAPRYKTVAQPVKKTSPPRSHFTVENSPDLRRFQSSPQAVATVEGTIPSRTVHKSTAQGPTLTTPWTGLLPRRDIHGSTEDIHPSRSIESYRERKRESGYHCEISRLRKRRTVSTNTLATEDHPMMNGLRTTAPRRM